MATMFTLAVGMRLPSLPVHGALRFERNVPFMIAVPPSAGRISNVPLSESPWSLPVVTVTTWRGAVGLWDGPISSTRAVALAWRARTGDGGGSTFGDMSV